MRFCLMAGLIAALILGVGEGAARAADPNCVVIMMDWEPLLEMVSDNFEALEAEDFRGLEHEFVQRGQCLKYVPIPWRMLPSSDLFSRKMLHLVRRPLSLGQGDFVRDFLAELNKAKLIRGYEHKKGKLSSRSGCTEVVLELKIYGGVYALSISHKHRSWAECPVKFVRNSRGPAEILTTGVRVPKLDDDESSDR